MQKKEGKEKQKRREKVRKTSGITLIALVVTIVVLLILAGITINMVLGDNGIFRTADEAEIEHRKGEIIDLLNTAEANVSLKALGKPSLEEYIKYIQDEEIVIEAEKQEDGSYEVTTEDGYVFSITIVEGTSVNDIVIGYEGQAGNLPSVVRVSEVTENSITVTVKRVEGARNISYGIRKVGEGSYNVVVPTSTETSYEFKDLEQGTEYEIEVRVTIGEEERVLTTKGTTTNPETIISDGSFSSEKGVNTPKLVAGMTPVVWDETANSGQGEWVEAESVDEWYNYKTTEVNGTQAKQWANAMTKDGSLWVWIPRYAYQIETNYHTNSTTGGTINIEFLKETTNEGATGKTIVEYNANTTNNYANFPNGYVVHPGFEYEETAPGLWVAKFEASQSDAGTTSTDMGSSGVIKIQPGVTSWRSITIGEMYQKCLNYAGTTLGNSSLNSHLMKNTEWGAVAYLSRSKYGKNGEIWINPNSNFLTGQAGTGPSVSSTETTYPYSDETNGVQASTTGNIYGIYDINGGSTEYTAAYINNSYIKYTGSEQYGNGEALIKGAPYTKDVYEVGTTDSLANNYTANQGKYGDAMWETSNEDGTSPYTDSWHQDYSDFPYTTAPFFHYGGYCGGTTRSGAFYFSKATGYVHAYHGFRPVLAIL